MQDVWELHAVTRRRTSASLWAVDPPPQVNLMAAGSSTLPVVLCSTLPRAPLELLSGCVCTSEKVKPLKASTQSCRGNNSKGTSTVMCLQYS
ncbi:hypothetical protein VPH35_123323 [Triticum aestivum]|uniref:Uncharacterized protein n=1 Tax=Triticum urartu TaxID=4572 RepID=A0A8R7V8U3_TRIUA